MKMNCGIVGLPNVGKSTLFTALTSAPAEASNYPFCTIEPNVGRVAVPDRRLEKITKLASTEKVVPATVDFIDIAGLVKGASRGEGLGNQFLASIREVGAICQVVRCFKDPDIIHINDKIDPLADIETINLELALADLQTVENRLQKIPKLRRSADKAVTKTAEILEPLLNQVYDTLQKGQPARSMEMADSDRNLLSDLHLITFKPMIYVCNTDENDSEGDNPEVAAVKEYAARDAVEVVKISGKLEAEIAAFTDPKDRVDFLKAAGLEEAGLDRMARSGYRTLGLRTFFTVGPKENRAWPFKIGSLAPEAAGVIHTDFQKGFIKAEIYHCQDLFELKSEAAIRKAGRLRQEGKDYPIKDGDIVFFKFN